MLQSTVRDHDAPSRTLTIFSSHYMYFSPVLICVVQVSGDHRPCTIVLSPVLSHPVAIFLRGRDPSYAVAIPPTRSPHIHVKLFSLPVFYYIINNSGSIFLLLCKITTIQHQAVKKALLTSY